MCPWALSCWGPTGTSSALCSLSHLISLQQSCSPGVQARLRPLLPWFFPSWLWPFPGVSVPSDSSSEWGGRGCSNGVPDPVYLLAGAAPSPGSVACSGCAGCVHVGGVALLFLCCTQRGSPKFLPWKHPPDLGPFGFGGSTKGVSVQSQLLLTLPSLPVCSRMCPNGLQQRCGFVGHQPWGFQLKPWRGGSIMEGGCLDHLGKKLP